MLLLVIVVNAVFVVNAAYHCDECCLLSVIGVNTVCCYWSDCLSLGRVLSLIVVNAVIAVNAIIVVNSANPLLTEELAACGELCLVNAACNCGE